jgi:putative PIN family toxin of toxin-antitoxin system
METDRTLVLDTNLWISRLLMPRGAAAQAVDRALIWGIPLMSEATLAELVDVLSRPKCDKYLSIKDRQHFIRLLGGIVRIVPITHRVVVCRDPKDDKFLHVALNGGAKLLVTGDDDLLTLNPFHGVTIVSPTTFLLESKDDRSWPL